jgi:hypothetical protein
MAEEQNPRLWIADGWTAKVIKNNYSRDISSWRWSFSASGMVSPSF